jgi:hypothetical protein
LHNKYYRSLTTRGTIVGWYFDLEAQQAWAERNVWSYRKIRKTPRKLAGQAAEEREARREAYRRQRGNRVLAGAVLTLQEQTCLRTINADFSLDAKAREDQRRREEEERAVESQKLQCLMDSLLQGVDRA